MSLIGTQVADYKLQGYQGGDFKEFTAEGAKGKWAVYVFLSGRFHVRLSNRIRRFSG